MISLEAVTEATHADSAALMMPNIDEGYNYCYASYNMPDEWVAIKNSFDENIPGGNVEVYKTGKAAVTNHLQTMLEGHYIESVMIVPVFRDDTTVAMLELVHSTDDKIFSDDDLKLAQAYAKQLAVELHD